MPGVVSAAMSVPVEEIKILVALLEQHQEPGERKEVVSKLYSVLVRVPKHAL